MRIPQLSALAGNESALLFRLIASHVAELTRPFDEASLFIGVEALLD
jgi:hypothetical protein